MTPIADLVARLIAASTPPELAAVVVAEAFAEGARSVEFRGHSVDETAERRRAKDRDRKRLKRGIPPKSADIPRNSAPPLTSSPQKDSVEKEGKKVRARKSFLSAEFQPKPSHFEAAAKLKYRDPRQAVLDKTEDMKVWAHGKGEQRADWDATLHGFLRRDAKQNAEKRGGSVHDAIDRLHNKVSAWERGDEPDLLTDVRDGTGQTHVRLLSKG